MITAELRLFRRFGSAILGAMERPPTSLGRVSRPGLVVLVGGTLGLGSGCFNPPPPEMETEAGTGPIGSTSVDPGATGVDSDTSTSASTGPVDPDGGSSSSSSETTEAPPMCPEGEIECATECFDPLTDPEHCGDCETICSATEQCTEGECVSTCAMEEIDCGGQCVDPLSSSDYCGAGPDCAAMPGIACGLGESCIEGSCVLPSVCVGFAAGVFDSEIVASSPNLVGSRMAIAWDGASLWTSSGGGSGGIRLAEHDAMGALIMDYQPGLDLRSVFTQGDGTTPLYARAYNNPIIRVQMAPGVFADHVTLVGGTLDPQSSVAWHPVDDLYIAHTNGTVSRWDAMGTLVDSITLEGFGSMGDEALFPQSRGIAFGQGCYLTINDGILSAWNADGDRIDTAVLNQAVPGEFHSNFSVSYAMGRAWHGGEPDWHGYDVFDVAP